MSALRHSLLFFIVLLGLARAEEAPLHSFNLLDGRSINARIIAADAKTVTLQRSDKLTFTLEQKVFDTGDQARIREWLIGDLLDKGKLVKLTGESHVTDLTVQREDGLLTYTWICTIGVTLTNTSPYTLRSLSVNTHWTLKPGSLAQPSTESAPAPEVTDNQHDEGILESGSAVTQSSKVPMKATVLEEGWTWPGGGNAPVMDKLSPIEVTASFQEKVVAKLTLEPAAPDLTKAKDKTSTAHDEAEQ